MNSLKTLWMGNIESWMDEKYLNEFLKELKIYPKQLSIVKKENKKGCAFLEFSTTSLAEDILRNFNGKKHKNIYLKFNWTKVKSKLSKPNDFPTESMEEKIIKEFIEDQTTQNIQQVKSSRETQNVNNTEKNYNKISSSMSQKYTVFVGNIHRKTTNLELFDYLKQFYSSITKVKIIVDQNTKESKGYGFVDFDNYEDYQLILTKKNEHLLNNNYLIVNTTKNKVNDLEINVNSSNIMKEPSTNPSNISNTPTQQSTDTNFSDYPLCCTKHTKPNDDFCSLKNDQNEQFNFELQRGFQTVANCYRCNHSLNMRYSACNYYFNIENLVYANNDCYSNRFFSSRSSNSYDFELYDDLKSVQVSNKYSYFLKNHQLY